MTYRSSSHPRGATDEKYAHEITRDIVNRHLSDINDTISEEDIRKVNITKLPLSYLEEDEKANIADANKTSVSDKNNEGKIPTPWNIIEG